MRRRALAARAALVVVLWPFMNAVAHACPICFQVEDGHVAGGVRAAVAVLVSVTTAVVGVCAVFVGRLVRLQPDEPESQSLNPLTQSLNPLTQSLNPLTQSLNPLIQNPHPGTPEPAPRNLGTPEPRNLQ